MNRVNAVELRPGYRISTIIRGCRPGSGPDGDLDSAASLADMTAFVDAGITTIDCGDGDPGMERVIGSLLQDLQRTHGRTIARSVRVHNKLIPDLSGAGTFNQSQVENAIDQSIARLGVDVLDLVQLHWPSDDTSGCLDALGYLTLMQAKGKIRHIGVSDFDTDHLKMFMQSGIDIVTAQVPFSLIDQRPRGDFADLCRVHKIALLAYGTLAGGFISHRWLGASDPGYRFEAPALARHRLVIEAFGGWALFQELLLGLSAIAGRHGVTLSSVALRAMHDHADVTSIILRSTMADQLDGHLRA
ncbi:MAG: aldo/keto reductase, partial [Geminicoccaceae bacterium]